MGAVVEDDGLNPANPGDNAAKELHWRLAPARDIDQKPRQSVEIPDLSYNFIGALSDILGYFSTALFLKFQIERWAPRRSSGTLRPKVPGEFSSSPKATQEVGTILKIEPTLFVLGIAFRHAEPPVAKG